jgi:hypothetical protein
MAATPLWDSRDWRTAFFEESWGFCENVELYSRVKVKQVFEEARGCLPWSMQAWVSLLELRCVFESAQLTRLGSHSEVERLPLSGQCIICLTSLTPQKYRPQGSYGFQEHLRSSPGLVCIRCTGALGSTSAKWKGKIGERTSTRHERNELKSNNEALIWSLS